MKICTKCKESKEFSEFGKSNKVKSGYKSACKRCINADGRIYHLKTKEYQKIRKQKYYIENKEYIIKRTSAYNINRRNTDIMYRIKLNLRKRIRGILLSKRLNKNNNFAKYIGCSLPELKNHLEKQFQPGMTWDNYGLWEIDHIKPFAQNNDIKILYKLCHYTNLQPLWRSQNRSKHDN